MSAKRFEDHIVFDFDTIKAQNQPPLISSVPINCKSQLDAGVKRMRHLHRSTSPKIVTGSPKSLCLPRLRGLGDIISVLIVRQECPWDTYQPAITYNIAGEVTIAARRTRPSRVAAIRKYREQDARRLIGRFGRLGHVNVLSFHECYIHNTFAFFLVDDLPLTLAHVVACSAIYPTETELGSIMWQVCPS